MCAYVRYFGAACMTYASVIAQVERPGTELHTGWAHLPAPQIAKSYWRLPDNATFADTLKCMVSVCPVFLLSPHCVHCILLLPHNQVAYPHSDRAISHRGAYSLQTRATTAT
jgi:hypothetical protein